MTYEHSEKCSPTHRRFLVIGQRRGETASGHVLVFGTVEVYHVTRCLGPEGSSEPMWPIRGVIRSKITSFSFMLLIMWLLSSWSQQGCSTSKHCSSIAGKKSEFGFFQNSSIRVKD